MQILSVFLWFKLLFFYIQINIYFFKCRLTVFNRPGVQTPLSFINSLINSANHPFPPVLQITFSPKREELESWHFEKIFTSHDLSHVMYHISRVICHVSRVMCHVTCDIFLDKVVSWWRVCYQGGLPCLGLKPNGFLNKDTYLCFFSFLFAFYFIRLLKNIDWKFWIVYILKLDVLKWAYIFSFVPL